MKKGTPDTAPLPEPPARGTAEQHGPAFPLGERANVLLQLFKGLSTQVGGFLRSSVDARGRPIKLSRGILRWAVRPFKEL